MSININHTNNTFCSNSGVFIFGTGIVPIIEDAVYSSNFSGKYHGDGSALTGLVAGLDICSFNTNKYLFVGDLNQANVLNEFSDSVFICSKDINTAISWNDVFINASCSSLCYMALCNTVISSKDSKICCRSCNNVIIGGSGNLIGQDNCNVILIGSSLTGTSNNTLYASNFCAYDGAFYGNGSGITGIVGAGGTSTPQQSGVLLTGATGFTEYHQAKNVGIIAQNCFFGQEGAGNSGYLLLDKGGVNETNNLFTVSPTTYCIGTFSAMLIGNGYVNGAATTTSMRIDGAYGNGAILNQVKNIYYRTQDSNDANVVIENNAFRIAVSGVSGTMVWSSKIDLLDMNGYD